MSELTDIAFDFLTAVNRDLNEITSDKGTVERTSEGAIMKSPYYIQFAKYGRGAGKAPPVDPIKEWIIKKGIIKDASKIDSLAFAIAKRIGERGTLNYVANAPNVIIEALDKHKKVYLEGLSEAFRGYIQDEMTGRLFVEELSF
jgi:hypothetical protein